MRAAGFDFFTGVPCSFLTPLLNRVIGEPAIRYVGAASEGEAVGIASGASLAGRKTVVMCQNSGLGNTVNPIVSLNHPFRIPTLMIVTWRGQSGLNDEPQHAVMGEITQSLLKVIRVPHAIFPRNPGNWGSVLAKADDYFARTNLPFALIMEHGTLCEETLEMPASPPRFHCRPIVLTRGGARPARVDVIERILAEAPPEAGIIATTGKCGRELFTLADREQHLYQVGSMGCASAMGLGLALNTHRPMVVLDGDGAALMKLGNLATIGAQRPKNLVHVVLDNGTHDSTGGQPTASEGVDLAAIAAACSYACTWSCDDLDGFDTAFCAALRQVGPALIHMRIRPGSLRKLGRPTIPPHEVAARFKAFLASAPNGQA